MKLIEQLSCRITPPPKKTRKEPGHYDLDSRRPGLQEAINRVNETGVAEWLHSDFTLYHIKRQELKDDKQGKGYLNVHVAEYGLLFTFGVQDAPPVK